ncbi:rod shape-determining protein MreD [Litorivita pollutaquae]|nr:rod shape-determining protein MreD [Litorivita pollutaquae]
MGEHPLWRLWSMRAMYLALCIFLIFFNLMPLETLPRAWAGPDLLAAFTCAWVLRRPEYVPVLAVASIALLADFLYQRPPGLWAALMVLITEGLRARAISLRDQSFIVEWITVTSGLIILALSYRIILAMLLVDQAPLGLSLIQLIMTLACYPIAVLITITLFRVRRPSLAEVNALGQRL